MNRSKIIMFVTLGFVLFILIGIASFYFSNTNLDKAGNAPEIKTFSENFIKDFSTYKKTGAKDYSKRMRAYLSEEYKESFNDRFGIQASDYVSPEEKEDYSKFTSAEVLVADSEDGNTFDVKIKYQAQVLIKDVATSPFNRDGAIIMSVTKDAPYNVTSVSYDEVEGLK